MSTIWRPLLLALFATILPTGLSGLMQPALAQPPGGGSHHNSAFFKKAKQELNESYYFLYRIVDRLARANQLDSSPWRVIRIAEYNVNAFATEINLIAVYTGLLDVLAGDSDAMACVIAHEMTHHVKRHIPLSAKNRAMATQRLEAREGEIVRREQQRQSNAQVLSVFGSIIGAATGVNIPVNPGGTTDPQRIAQELASAKNSEEQTLALISQQHEFEADRGAYSYVARAGFDPRGCLRVMDVLGRTPGAEFDGSHPAIPRRVEQLNTLLRDIPTQPLAAEGKARLLGTRALTYAKSSDGKSLRVNSRFGSSKGGFTMSDY